MTKTSDSVFLNVFSKLPHFATIDTEKSVFGVSCRDGRKSDDGKFFIMDVGPTWFGSPIIRRGIAIFRTPKPKQLGKDYKHAGKIKIGGRQAHIFLRTAE